MPINKIKFLMLKISNKKTPGPDGFIGEFYQIIFKDLISILEKLFQQIEKQGTLSNSFYEAILPKPGKHKRKQ